MTEPIRVRARKFLLEFFSDEDLTNFCFDYFPQVYNDFTQGMVKSQKVRMLVENSRRRGRFDELLAALERERPKSYPEHFAEQPQLIDSEPQPLKTIERNPHQIFISHAHQDANFARRLAADLRNNGWQTWIAPDDIRPGEKWVEAINRGLVESGVFVLVITPESVNSRWVQTETNVAIGMEHRQEMQLIPLNVKPTITPALWGAYQWIAFDGEYEVALETFLEELTSQKKLPTEVAATPQPITPEKNVEPESSTDFEHSSANQTEYPTSTEVETKLSLLQATIARIKSMPRRVLIAGISIILLIILLVMFLPDAINLPPVQPTEVVVVATEEPTLESTPRPTESSTPTIDATATAIVAEVKQTVEDLEDQAVQLTNSQSGSLLHDDDNLFEHYIVGVSVSNFITEARFFNPYDAEDHSWNYGFVFRVKLVEGSNSCLCYRLYVDSRKQWKLILVTSVDPFDVDVIKSGTISNLNTSSGEFNDLRLIVQDEIGYFFVNNEFITYLDVNSHLDRGRVEVATGMTSGAEVEGNSTRFENFIVWNLDN